MTQQSQSASLTISSAVWGMLILLGAIWGGSFFFARIAVAEINPFVLVLERVAIAAVALQLYLPVAGPSFAQAMPYAGRFFGLALLNNVIPFSLIFLGQTQMGAGLASVLNATTPFWTLIVAQFLTADEKLSANKLAGIALGVIGTAVMVGPGVVAGLGGPVWAKFALIGASLSYAFALIYSRRMFTGVARELIATGQLTASTIIMAPIILIAFGANTTYVGSMPVVSAVLALALLSTAFAYILFFRIIAAAGATNASLVTLIVPVFAMLLGIAFLGEHLELFEILGMLLIGVGLIVIDGRFLRRR
jgi:drug/metabolite transporter (DMT)-like permease